MPSNAPTALTVSAPASPGVQDQFSATGSVDAPGQSGLTQWVNEPSLATLQRDLEAARPSHDAHQLEVNRWLDLLHVRNKAKPPVIKGRSSVQPKLVRKQAEWRYPSLSEPFLESDRMFQVQPRTFEDKAGADQNQLVLNWQFGTKLNRVKLVDEFVRTAVDEGTVVLRLGWDRQVRKVKETVPVWGLQVISPQDQGVQEFIQQLQQALELKHTDPRTYNEQVPPELQASVDFFEDSQQVGIATQTGSQVVLVDKVVRNQPTVDVLNQANVYIDPSCNGDVRKALFVIHSFETNQAELTAQTGLYKNLEKVDWRGNSPNTTNNHESSIPNDFSFADKARNKVVAYEYWGFYDVNNDGILVPFVATWIGNVLIRLEESPFPDKELPFVVVAYTPRARSVHGEPDAEILEDNQKILGALTRGMIDLMGRSANAQQGFAKGMLDPLNMRRFKNGDDYEFNPSLKPDAGHITHTYPEIPQSAMVLANVQSTEAESMTGTKAFTGGLTGESYGQVATGIKGMLTAAARREMSILRRLAYGMSEVGRKIISMNAEFLSDQEVIRVTNEEYVTVNREDLKGEFDCIVDISTSEIDNTKAQDLGFMLQTIGPNMDSGIYMLILSEISDLKRMPELAQKLRTWQPQPDPVQQQMQQLEMTKLQAEIAQLQAQAEYYRGRGMESESRAQLDGMKARDQASGLDHARKMEAQGAQAQGNQSLEVTKALTRPVKAGEMQPNISAAIGFNQLSQMLDGANVSQ